MLQMPQVQPHLSTPSRGFNPDCTTKAASQMLHHKCWLQLVWCTSSEAASSLANCISVCVRLQPYIASVDMRWRSLLQHSLASGLKGYNLCMQWILHVDMDYNTHVGLVMCRSYLCTGFDCYVVQEPCAMCAMAATHARLRRMVYCLPDGRRGALGGAFKLHGQKSLNHHYQVFQLPVMEASRGNDPFTLCQAVVNDHT